MPHAQIHLMANCGHAPFWENAVEFNRRLGVFAQGLSRCDLTAHRPARCV